MTLISLIEHPWLLFPVLLVGLVLLVEVGLRISQASPGLSEDHQSLIQTARDGLTMLVSFLLGFSLVMA